MLKFFHHIFSELISIYFTPLYKDGSHYRFSSIHTQTKVIDN